MSVRVANFEHVSCIMYVCEFVVYPVKKQEGTDVSKVNHIYSYVYYTKTTPVISTALTCWTLQLDPGRCLPHVLLPLAWMQMDMLLRRRLLRQELS